MTTMHCVRQSEGGISLLESKESENIKGLWNNNMSLASFHSLETPCLHVSFSLCTSSAGLFCWAKGVSSENTMFLKLKLIPPHTVLSAGAPAGTHIRGCWVDWGSCWAVSHASEHVRVDGISLGLIWVSRGGWAGPGLKLCARGDKGERGKNKWADVPSDSVLQTVPGHVVSGEDVRILFSESNWSLSLASQSKCRASDKQRCFVHLSQMESADTLSL